MTLIKINISLLLMILMTTFSSAQTNNFCSDYKFESIQAQADSIDLFMEKALKSNSEEKSKWERKFFCAFPNSYATMDSLFGFNKKAGPLYHSETPEHLQFYGNMSSHIDFFSQLSSIPSDEYYDKYIDICIDGYWQADNITVAFGFGLHLLNNTKTACAALSKRKDSEIKSVFRFVFDGAHPNNETNKEFFKLLHPVIKTENIRLAQLLTDAYNKLMSEDHRH